MSERHDLLVGGLEAELLELRHALAFPAPRPDFATRVTQRIAPRRATQSWWRRESRVFGRPVRRAVLLALALLLVLAAVAGAVGLGLPGLRIIFGFPAGASAPPSAPLATPGPSPVASSSAPGAGLGLGRDVALDQLDQVAGFHVRSPGDPAVGPPDQAYVDPARANQASLVWSARPDLPPTLEPEVGLLLTQFDGRIDQGFFSKSIGGGTSVQPVLVNGAAAYWVSGEPHFYFYTARTGQFVDDDRRWVGDALLWSDGTYTYRIETSLGRAAAIRIAESIR